MPILISTTIRDLSGEIISLRTKAIEGLYPTHFQTFEEAWDNLHQSYAFLRKKWDEDCYRQILEMTAQARAHFEVGYMQAGKTRDPVAGFVHVGRLRPGDVGFEEIKLGARLMQDVEQVVKRKPPFAYPKELYRWPREDA